MAPRSTRLLSSMQKFILLLDYILCLLLLVAIIYTCSFGFISQSVIFYQGGAYDVGWSWWWRLGDHLSPTYLI